MNCSGESKMIRCGQCRRAKKYYCAGCDIEVFRHHKIYCNDCAYFARLRYSRESQRHYRKANWDSILAKQRESRAKRKELNKSKLIIS